MSDNIESEFNRNTEYLVQLLNKEWERTGATKEVQVIGLRDINLVNFEITRRIRENKEQQLYELSFADSLKYARENYVLLRLAKKIKAERDKADSKNQRWFYVGLDIEELRLFEKITKDEEAGGM